MLLREKRDFPSCFGVLGMANWVIASKRVEAQAPSIQKRVLAICKRPFSFQSCNYLRDLFSRVGREKPTGGPATMYPRFLFLVSYPNHDKYPCGHVSNPI